MKKFFFGLMLLTITLMMSGCDLFGRDGCDDTDADIVTYKLNDPFLYYEMTDRFVQYVYPTHKVMVKGTITITKHRCGGKNTNVYSQTITYIHDNHSFHTAHTLVYRYTTMIELHNTEDYISVDGKVEVFVDGGLYKTYFGSDSYYYHTSTGVMEAHPELKVIVDL